jgi:tRNA modification GTPase
VHAELQQLVRGSKFGLLAREGARVAIIGPPNAGKSSLLNGLLGEERVLVSPVAGTTRDTIEEALDLDGVVIRIVDTAGIRMQADALEAAGIERTRATLAQARLALIVVDGSQPLDAEAQALLAETRGIERLVLYNKSDLGHAGFAAREAAEHDALHGSVQTTQTIIAVRAALRNVLVGSTARIDLERPALTRTRELDAAHRALEAISTAQATLGIGEPLDLLTGDLNAAIAALGKITGATVSEEMLDAIFARFCIGK